MTTPNPPAEPDQARPPEHEKLIFIMQQNSPPPATPDAPAMPDQLLRELQEHYEPKTESGPYILPVPAAPNIVTTPANRNQGRSYRSLAGLGIAALAVALGIAHFQIDGESTETQFYRGGMAQVSPQTSYRGETEPTRSKINYRWQGPASADALRQAMIDNGVALHTATDPTMPSPALKPATPAVDVFIDATAHSLSVMINGQPRPDLTVQLPVDADNDDWLDAIDSLERKLQPSLTR
jgi:hypothetical protein